MDLYQSIKQLYPDINDEDFVLYDDGSGARILRWYSTQPQPTQDELNSAWADAVLKSAKDEKLKELNSKCSQTILGNFPYVVNGITYYFPNDATAQTNFDKFYITFRDGLATSPEKFTCYDTNGNVCRLPFDQSTFPDLYKAHCMHIAMNVSKFRDTLQPQVESATTIDEVNAITWNILSISDTINSSDTVTTG
jgi:hypothetical protein